MSLCGKKERKRGRKRGRERDRLCSRGGHLFLHKVADPQSPPHTLDTSSAPSHTHTSDHQNTRERERKKKVRKEVEREGTLCQECPKAERKGPAMGCRQC